MYKKSINSKKIALSGILLAFCVSTLYFQSIFPLADYTIYIISSLYIGIIIIELGFSNAILFYFASCILSLIIVPNKIFLLPYLLFFGIYGLIKFQIEKMNNIYFEIALKLLIFNTIAGLSVLLLKDMLFQSISLPQMPLLLIIIVLEIAFIAFDYFYTLFLDFYIRRIKKSI